MRKFFILTLLITTVVVFGQVNNYDMELVHTFVAGDYSPKYIEPYLGPQTNNPASFYFDNDGNLFVADSTFRRIVKYDKDFNFIEEYVKLKSSVFRNISIQRDIVYATSKRSILIEKLSGEVILYLNRSKNKIFNNVAFNKYFLYENGVVTLSTIDGSIYRIENPSSNPESNVIQKIPNENSEEKVSRSTGTIDNSFDEFSYFLKYRKNISEPEEVENRSTENNAIKLSDIEFTSEKLMSYIGSDRDGNVYWNDSYRKILIFNSNYQLIDAFNTGLDYADTDPVVHPSGDVYFMNITNEEAKLLRVKRVW